MPLYLTEAEVERLIDMSDAISAIEAAHHDLALGKAQDVPRERTRLPQISLHLLQGAYPAEGVIGYKTYTAHRTGNRFWVHLFDIESGRWLAVIEANHLGRLRTGAAAGVATRLLSNPSARVLGVLGAGFQSSMQIEAICAVRPIKEVRVFARRPEPLRAFCEQMSSRFALPVIPAESVCGAVQGADVVSTVTSASSPVLLDEQVKEGVHINAVGSNALIRRELDEALLRRAGCICVDSRATAIKESGDLLPLLEKGRTHPAQWVELGELIARLRPGRESQQAVTIFESQGLAIQDLALAARVYQRAIEKGLGKDCPTL